MTLSHRGFMLDTSRKFFPKDVIYKILDWMALGKMNIFHWHFMDDESFSIEWTYDNSKLTLASKNFTNNPCYSKQDIQDIINYASSKGITVIPEVEIPGHCSIIKYAYPNVVSCQGTSVELNLKNSDTFNFLGHLLTDIMSIFPGTTVHLGGDEVACIWPDTNPSQTLTNFYNQFLLNQAKSRTKKLTIWQDPVTDKKVIVDKSFTIQVWKDYPSLQTVLYAGYNIIVSNSDTWYIGNCTQDKLNKFVFPQLNGKIDPKIKGAELVWFTSERDNPCDIDWVKDTIIAAGLKMYNQ